MEDEGEGVLIEYYCFNEDNQGGNIRYVNDRVQLTDGDFRSENRDRIQYTVLRCSFIVQRKYVISCLHYQKSFLNPCLNPAR